MVPYGTLCVYDCLNPFCLLVFEARSKKGKTMEVLSLNPKDCRKWEFADRSEFEFNKIWELAEDIKRNGQIDPAIVRPIDHQDYKYEVIAGARRWKACYDHDLPFLAVVSELNDNQAAIAQIKENQKLAICDYSKGLCYSRLLNSKKLTQAELSNNIQISKAKLKDFLTFAKVDKNIWETVSNMSKVSPRTSREILSISSKGKKYCDALIELSEEIRNGIGANSLKKAVDNIVLGAPEVSTLQKPLTLPSGIVIGTWQSNSIKFSNNIEFNHDDLEKHLIEFFDRS